MVMLTKYCRFLRHTMTLLQDQDQYSLITDPSIMLSSADGRQQPVIPFRLGAQQPMVRRDAQGVPRPYPTLGVQPSIPQQSAVAISLPLAANGIPISVPAQMKKMQPPVGLPQMRISSNGGMRPPGAPVVASLPQNMAAPHSSPPHLNAAQHINGVNTIARSANHLGHPEGGKPEADTNSLTSNGVVQIQSDGTPSSDSTNSPVRHKSQEHHHGVPVPNGYHLTAINGYPAMPNGSPYLHHPNAPHNVLSIQQKQNLKSAFAANAGQEGNPMQSNGGRPLPASYMAHVVPNGANFNMQLAAGANMNLKLPASRQMQWAALPSRPNNGVEAVVMNGSMSPNLSPTHPVPGGPPVRTPSANGSRAGMRGGVAPSVSHVIGPGSGVQLGSHTMSPHLQHSPSPMPPSLPQAQSSPPRPTSTLAMASPSLQHQQPIGSSQGGY